MTAISYLGVTNGTTTNGPVTMTLPASGGANKRMAFFVWNCEASASCTLTDVRFDSAGANTALTFVGRWSYDGTQDQFIEVWRLPEASMLTGSRTFSWTVSGTPAIARQSIVTFDGVDQTTPTNGTSTTSISSASASTSVDVNTDGGALGVHTVTTSTVTTTWNNSWTEIVDAAMSTNAARSIGYNIASGTQTASVTLSGSDTGVLAAIAINANGFTTAIDLTAVNGGSAITEGQTSVALVGTSLNASGAGVRLRLVSAPSTYQAMSNYVASTSIAATADVPTLTSLPFTTASWTHEAIGTATGGNDGTPVSVTLNPASGYSVVEIGATPDLSAASLLSYLGWTAIATDQIEWDNSVTVSGTAVTITVNADGTVTLDSSPSAMPSSVTFDWRAWDSASKLWTNWATATFGSTAATTVAGTVVNTIVRTIVNRRK